MKPSQAFGVVVRVLGLLGWLTSFIYLYSAGLIWVFPNYRTNISPAWHYLLASALFFLVGWFLLRRAHLVVAFAYKLRGSDTSDA